MTERDDYMRRQDAEHDMIRMRQPRSITPPTAVPEQGEVIQSDHSVTFLEKTACYFENRPTGGEDLAHWANVYNAENCRKAAIAIRTLGAEAERWENERDKWFDRTAIHNLARLAAEAQLREATKALEEICGPVANEPDGEDENCQQTVSAFWRSLAIRYRKIARNIISPKETT